MTVVQNPLIGRASGKLNNVIFQTSYEKNIIRSRPAAYRDAGSETQLAQRNRFLECLRYTRKLLPAARTGLAAYGRTKSVYAYLLGYIMKYAWTLQGGVYKVDPNLCITSKGDLLGFSNLHCEPAGNMGGSYFWTSNTGQQNALGDDRVYAVLFCSQLNEAIYYLNIWERDEAEGAWSLPATWNGKVVQSWLFFKGLSSSLVCNSEYVEFVPFI